MSFALGLDVDTAKVAGGQNPARQLGSQCLSPGPKRSLLEAENSLQLPLVFLSLSGKTEAIFYFPPPAPCLADVGYRRQGSSCL